MQIATQLAVFLENKPGTLARVCEALAEARINIYAMSTSDTVDHTVLRLILSDPRKALYLFEERGTLVAENEVLLIEAENRPGVLGRVARLLAEAKINIEYCYCASSPQAKRGLLVIRTSNTRKALKVLNS